MTKILSGYIDDARSDGSYSTGEVNSKSAKSKNESADKSQNDNSAYWSDEMFDNGHY